MAIEKGQPISFGAQLTEAVAPVTGTVDGVALETQPTLIVGSVDSYLVSLSATEMGADTPYVLLIDSEDKEYGFTVFTDDTPALLSDIDDFLTIQHGVGSWQREDIGDGDTLHPYRMLLDSDGDGVPDEPNVGIYDVRVKVTTDSSGLLQVAQARTDMNGWVVFMLNAGTYYLWRYHPDYAFSNPDLETVS